MFLFLERVIYSDGVNNVYEHGIEASSHLEAKEKADKILEETKKLLGNDGRCSFFNLRLISGEAKEIHIIKF